MSSQKSLPSWTFCVLLVSFVLLAGNLAAADGGQTSYPACSHKPSKEEIGKAKDAHRVASKTYEDGDYNQALANWHAAYALDCTAHGILINIAKGYKKRGDAAAELAALQTYLDRLLEAPDKVEVSQRVDTLKRALVPVPRPTASSTVIAPVASTAKSLGQQPTAKKTTSNGPKEQPDLSTSSAVRVLSWVTTATGGASTVVGAVLLQSGVRSLSEVEERCPDKHCPADIPKSERRDLVERGNSALIRAQVGEVMLIAGLATAGGGLVWVLLSPPASVQSTRGTVSAPSRTSIAHHFELQPQVGLKGGKLILRGNF